MKGGAYGKLKSNISKSNIMKKNGSELLPMSYGGVKFDLDKANEIGKAIGGRAYFYVISIDCPCIDGIGNQGKVKIGYSGAKVSNFALRLSDYIRYFGTKSIKVHLILVFGYKNLAVNFETKVKRELKDLDNYSGLAKDISKPVANKEWFSILKKKYILDTIAKIRADPNWNVKYEFDKKKGLRSGEKETYEYLPDDVA